ncbi:TonB-dependent siderophore receptor [Parapedobacter sp. DT-150]|uniref:TonB-dependent siderophore receptor n=1 Tax=Parapedobacter sp. DT-150 TaxID=3396162 RepID=UPI003F1BCE49
MKNIIPYLLLVLLVAALHKNSYSQNPSLAGQVVSAANQQPLQGVTVRVSGISGGRVTNANGNFSFENLSNGQYTLTFSYLGYEATRITIALPSSNGTDLSVILKPIENQLQAVEIIGRKEQTYKNTSSFAGTKTETPLKYVPQAISYVTKEVIDDQQAFKTSDVLKNISGVNVFSYYNNDFTLRGFRAGNALINGLRDATNSWSQSLLPNVERIEVIKGPASALFANTDPGGTVNTVTKKPLDVDRKSVSFATGSYNTYRMTSDFTGPMNKEKTLLYRLNLAYQNAQSFRVLQGGEDIVIAPSISFIPTDRTQVNVDFVYSKTKSRLDRGQPIFGASAGTDLHSTPVSFAIGKENDYENELNLYTTASLQHKFTDNISFNASYMKFLYDEDLLEHRTSNRYAVDADGQQIPTLMEMQTIRRKQRNYNDNITLYFVSDFKTGPLTHKLLVGYDYIQNVSPVGGSNYNAAGYRNADNSGIIGTYVPENRDDYLISDNRPVPNVPHFDLTNPDYAISEISGYFNVSSQQAITKYYVNGVYLQDQITWGPVQALLAVRQEYYTDILNYQKDNEETVQQQKLIPRFGLVYTPVEPVSLYVTYAQGYQPQGAGTIGDPERFGGPFDPLTSTMYEGGAKMEFLNKHLSINAAIYHIEQNNILINANDPGNPDLLRQLGQQRSRGIELDVYGQLLPNLSVTANMAINETIITESDNDEEEGNLLPNAPKQQGGIWAKYTFNIPALNGIGIGAGANYVSTRATLSDILTLPSYVVADAALYYTIDKFKLSANLNNVFNKTHWVGGYDFNRLYPGTPRNFLIGIGYTF